MGWELHDIGKGQRDSTKMRHIFYLHPSLRIGSEPKREIIPIVLKTIFQYGYR